MVEDEDEIFGQGWANPQAEYGRTCGTEEEPIV